MKDKHFNQWQVTRPKGMWHFIFYFGAQWSLIMFLLMNFLLPIVKDVSAFFSEGTESFFLESVTLLVCALAMGFLWGKSITQFHGKKYLSSLLWLVVALALTVSMCLLAGAEISIPPMSTTITILIVYLIIGFFLGAFLWASNEKSYQKEFERRKQDGMVA